MFWAGARLPLGGPLASREGLRALWLLGGSLWASWTGVTWQGCFRTSTCWSVVSREASIVSSLEPRPPHPPASAVRAGEEPDHPDGSLGPGQAGACPQAPPARVLSPGMREGAGCSASAFPGFGVRGWRGGGG